MDSAQACPRATVFDANGSLVHDDHVVWLVLQLALDGGSASATQGRLSVGHLRLTTGELTTLYRVPDNNGAQPNFLPLDVFIEDEWIDRKRHAGKASRSFSAGCT